MQEWIAGVDGCKEGWAVAYAPADNLSAARIIKCDTFEEILNHEQRFALIFIDIPIGLEQDKDRECDKLARKKLRPRGCCVFPAPLRSAVSVWQQDQYQEANQLTRDHHHLHHGLSKQSHSLFNKIFEVDELMTPELQDKVIETHLELIFAALNGEPLCDSKKSEVGYARRKKLLLRYFPILEASPEQPPPGIKRDDILDAYACLWAAHQYRRGNFHRLPESPSRDAKDLKMKMVFPKFPEK